MTTDGLPHIYSGKVRDIYDAGDGRLLMVTSDRLSAFDVVMAEPIPDKGRVLTAMSAFWFEQFDRRGGQPPASRPTSPTCPTAGAAPGAGRPDHAVPPGRDAPDRVHRPRLPHRLGVEGVPAATAPCTARPLPAGLLERRPAARAGLHPVDQGRRWDHDENISFERGRRPGRRRAGRAGPRRLARRSTPGARRGPPSAGIIIADTKFELGHGRRRAGAGRRGAHPGLVALLAGRPSGSRARRPRRSTSSRCATTSTTSTGTSSPPPPPLPDRRRRRPPAPATSRPTSASPVARFADWPGGLTACPGTDPGGVGMTRAHDLLGASSRSACGRASPIPRAPPSSGRSRRSASTGSASVRVGKSIRFSIEAADEAAARAEVEDMCQRFLTNPVIEDAVVDARGRGRGRGREPTGRGRPLPGHQLRARRASRPSALVGGEAELLWHGDADARRRRRRRRARRVRPRRLPAPRRHRPLLAGDGRGGRVRRRRWPGRRHLQRLPGAHRGRPAARARCRRTRASSSCAPRCTLRVESTDSVAHRRGRRPATVLRIPINHFEGNYTCDAETLARLRADDRIVLRYVDNPNGSVDDIAGICNEGRNVVGLMPHPERACQRRCSARPTAVLLLRSLRRPDRRSAPVGQPAAADAGRLQHGGGHADLAPGLVGDALALGVALGHGDELGLERGEVDRGARSSRARPAGRGAPGSARGGCSGSARRRARRRSRPRRLLHGVRRCACGPAWAGCSSSASR